ncbi:Transposase Tc1-like [Trinorchestia longiramus]|nr:Transposase Tc1-like [Trinorchestia longiramus]
MSAAGFEPGSSRSKADSLTSRPSWKHRTGRLRKINDFASLKLVRTVVQRPGTTHEKLKYDLNESGIETRKYTINRSLRCERFRSLTLHMTALQKRQVKARLKYANNHLNKPSTFWNSVLSSDETKSSYLGETAQTMFGSNKTKSINQSAPYPLLSLEVAQSWCGDVLAHQILDPI